MSKREQTVTITVNKTGESFTVQVKFPRKRKVK